MTSSPRPPRRRERLLAVGAVVALTSLLAGCGLRLETPPPAPPTPDANETARERAGADALGLEVLAAAPGGNPADPATSIRATVVALSGEHRDQLGSGDRSHPATPAPTTDPSGVPTTAATAKPAGTTPDVVARLVQTASNARTDAATVPAGPLARLLGSVSAARLLLARELAAAVGESPAPELAAVTVPESVPAGLAPSALSALVADEDEAGYGFEVIAAKLSDGARSRALDRAAVHRIRAEQWARLAKVAQTRLDPRRAAYALPAGLDDPAVATALAQSLEQSLATSYASLVAGAEPKSRLTLLDALTEATAAAVAWGAPVPAFPGLPERATG